ncbi:MULTISPECIES: arginine--tRNA ligase [Dysgonomonas]|uniref:arginine--tRNA ligase n=1 Tax=Dysgonomonas TaxID=156973 RepID=UPI000929CFFB|nr:MULTISPECIES: arginine--tRNA ligase [Dysgonomonas]MBN9302733.1 arginine--tRNA ligase [Dysgonomonas mossii]OJX59793.1 MAG: arginine--tRNA ligase [Dysgonomonas sp. 37-18]
MKLEIRLQEVIINAIDSLYGQVVTVGQLSLQKTKKEFEGHYTLVVFPFLKMSKKGPEQTAQEIGEWLKANASEVSSFNVIKGFLNLTIATTCWIDVLNEVHTAENYGITKADDNSPLVMVEYSSPNTNKPLHLGHIRNNLLGFALSEVLKANGNRVVKTNIVNDRGIHICKSMLAWQKWGNGETPESTGKKGDHLVGDYYVMFDKHYKAELAELQSKGLSKEEAEAQSTLMAEARNMLRLWEAGDLEVVSLWENMNSWVYAGFDETYKRLGVDFDKIYYESQTYLDGKETVLEGLQKNIFYKKEDGSVWADLTADGLDHKLLLRSDGTSVYMTQDIGTAKLRFDDFPINTMVYVVGNEQNYHFQVLSILLDKLGFEFGKGLVHFSYGMVELPEGKMKSREGTVVDADDLVDEMIATAKETSQELGKLDGVSEEEANNIARMVGMGALKYFILKVDPKKNMTFNPKESIDFNGNTGPFIQYTHARIQSILRKAAEQGISIPTTLSADISLSVKEEGLVQQVAEYASIVKQAGDEYNPALIANYIYDLVKEYNQFYHDYTILKEENADLKNFRLILSDNVGRVVKSGMSLLGIEVPDRM